METLGLRSRARALELRSGKLADAMMTGRYRSVFRGRGLEFEEVREYGPQDDYRSIDWNVTARTGVPHVKLYRDQRELCVFVLLDESASMAAGNDRTSAHCIAAETLALLAFACERSGDPCGAAFFSVDIEKWVKPGRGRRHASALAASAFESVPDGRGSDLGKAAEAAIRGLKRRSLVFLVSDFLSSGWEAPAYRLAERHDLVAVRVQATAEFPNLGISLPFVDPETGHAARIDFRSARSRSAYAKFLSSAKASWASSCARRAIPTLEILGSDDPAERLLSFFSARKP